LFVFLNLEFFWQDGHQCWALYAFLAACPYITYSYSILYVFLFVNWANKDACLLTLMPCFTTLYVQGEPKTRLFKSL